MGVFGLTTTPCERLHSTRKEEGVRWGKEWWARFNLLFLSFGVWYDTQSIQVCRIPLGIGWPLELGEPFRRTFSRCLPAPALPWLSVTLPCGDRYRDLMFSFTFRSSEGLSIIGEVQV